MKTIVFIYLILYSSVVFNQEVNRLEDSPYPSSNTSDSLFICFDDDFTDTELFTLQSLQGILAQTKPIIYRDMGTGSTIWLKDLKDNYGIETDSSYSGDLYGLISKFKSEFNGYVLYDEECKNHAISICSAVNGIPILDNQQSFFDSLNIPLIDDARNYSLQSLMNNYKESFSKKVCIYQKEEKSTFLGDYSIFSKAPYFFESPHHPITNSILSNMDENSVLLGWGDDEYQTISMASSNSIMTHPADYAANLSVLTNFNSEINQKNHTLNIDENDSSHYVCFVMSDGDNIQWLLNWFITDNRWFGNSNRGKADIGWTISPALSELAPTVMSKIYSESANTLNGKDYFIAGPSGIGYIFPEKYNSLISQCELLNRYMDKSDLGIVNIIGNKLDNLSLYPYLSQANIDGIFYYDYANYSAHNGDIIFVNNKPVITARYNLWGGFESSYSLASKINNLPKDCNSKNGYSLIPVHNWSNSVDSILNCIDLFNENINVVSPDEFIHLIKKNLSPQNQALHLANPNPTFDKTKIEFKANINKIKNVKIYGINGCEYLVPMSIASLSNNLTQITLDFEMLKNGKYLIKIDNDDNQNQIIPLVKL